MLWLWRLELKATNAVADATCCCVALIVLGLTRLLGPLCLSGLLVIDWIHETQEAVAIDGIIVAIDGIVKTQKAVVIDGTNKALEEAAAIDGMEKVRQAVAIMGSPNLQSLGSPRHKRQVPVLSMGLTRL